MGTSGAFARAARLPVVSAEKRKSTDPVQDLVIRASKRQEPRLAVVEAQWRAGEGNACERNFVTAAADPLRNFRSQVRRHRHPVTGISERIVHSVVLPSVRHRVETEVECASPGKFN